MILLGGLLHGAARADPDRRPLLAHLPARRRHLGFALLTKGTLLVLVPVVGVAVVVGARRAFAWVPPLDWRPTLVRLFAVWGLAFVIGGWWWAVNILRYGTVQPSGFQLGDPHGPAAQPAPEFAGIFWEGRRAPSGACSGSSSCR